LWQHPASATTLCGGGGWRGCLGHLSGLRPLPDGPALVQEAVDGASLEAQVCQGKRDAAEVLGIEQDRIAFVDADPDGVRKPRGPLVRVSLHLRGAIGADRRNIALALAGLGTLAREHGDRRPPVVESWAQGAQDSRFWVYVICVTWI
jgi:hypothetical protein